MSILGNSLEGRVTLSRVSVCLFILNPQDNCMNVYATCRTVLIELNSRVEQLSGIPFFYFYFAILDIKLIC